MAKLMKIVLSEKLDPSFQQEGLREFQKEIREILGDLKVRIIKIESEDDEWISVEYDGEDNEVFTEALRREYGLAPVQLSKLKLGDVYRGFIVGSGKVGYGLYIDMGIFSPSRRDGLYALHRMRSQLVDGEKQSLRQITKRYCLHDGFPLNVRIEELDTGKMSLALTERQESFFKDWEKYPFDRVIILGSLQNKVDTAIRKSHLDKDIIEVERLSLTSSILTCKLGTEAPGVISKLGPNLGSTKLYSFIPSVRVRI